MGNEAIQGVDPKQENTKITPKGMGKGTNVKSICRTSKGLDLELWAGLR